LRHGEGLRACDKTQARAAIGNVDHRLDWRQRQGQRSRSRTQSAVSECGACDRPSDRISTQIEKQPR